jgi:hypothetical protein
MTRAARLRWFTLQVLGFALCLVALIWCVRAALSPENREQLARVTSAPGAIAALVALTLLSLLCNGLIFWATLRPVRRVPLADMLAINALGTFLAYLPFKASMFARVAIHNRRHALPVTLTAGWFAAIAAVLLCTVGPPTAASLWRGRLDAPWWIASLGGIAALAVVMVVVARRIARWLAPSSALTTRARAALANIAQAFVILADARAVAATIALRILDTAAQALRLMLAASVIGHPLAAGDAVIISVCFFVIGIVSPAGMLGVREAGAAGVAGILAVAGSHEFAPVALLVGSAEAVTNLAAAALGVTWLLATRKKYAEIAEGDAEVAEKTGT